MSPVPAVLCVQKNSFYFDLPCDAYDEQRDARSFAGGTSVVAHPPCRLWGRLRTFARAENAENERELARWCARQVQQWGGILEHPAGSLLWADQQLPLPGAPADRFGGWTLKAPQLWWGFPAEKMSWFYIVGVPRRDVQIPLVLRAITRSVETRKHGSRRLLPGLSHSARSRTPIDLARWLLDLAGRSVASTPAPGDG